MSQIHTQITINARPTEIWRALVNYAQYPEWSTFLKEIHGEPKEGCILKVLLCPPGAKPMYFTPTLIKIEKEQEMRWVGKFLCRHVFQGEHYFQLQAISENQTQLTNGEIFSGILSPIFNWFMLKNAKKGFENFNQELKKRVENK